MKEWNEQERKELAKKAMDVVVESNNQKSDVVICLSTNPNDYKVYYSSSPSLKVGDALFPSQEGKAETHWCEPGTVWNDALQKCVPMYPDLQELKIVSITHAANYDNTTNINSLFDGLENTRFSVKSAVNDAEKPVDTFVLAVDLGAEQEIRELGIATYKGADRKYKLKVQLSNDPNNFVYTHEIETSGATNKMEFHTVGVEPIKAQFVRILGAGNSVNAWNSYTALKIRGRQLVDVQVKPQPKPDPDGPNDKDGIVKMYPTDPNMPSWYFSDLHGENDPEFEVDGETSKLTVVEHPVLGKIYTAKSREGGLASGGKQLTLRLHWNPLTSKGKQKIVSNYHEHIKEQGYIISAQDVKQIEQTAIVRFRGIKKEKGRMTHKVHGGIHTGEDDPRASCCAMMVSFEEARNELMELELFHPNYQFFKVNKLIAGLNWKTLDNQWLGTKQISLIEGDDVHLILQVNTNPFKSDGSINNANWTMYAEGTLKKGMKDSQGKPVEITPTWGGPITTWRINEVEQVDIHTLSVRSILTQ